MYSSDSSCHLYCKILCCGFRGEVVTSGDSSISKVKEEMKPHCVSLLCCIAIRSNGFIFDSTMLTVLCTEIVETVVSFAIDFLTFFKQQLLS